MDEYDLTPATFNAFLAEVEELEGCSSRTISGQLAFIEKLDYITVAYRPVLELME